MKQDIAKIEAALAQVRPQVLALQAELAQGVIGQSEMLQGLLIGLFSRGHVLLEGLPGLAKTRAVSRLAQSLGIKFSRIQFTPDMLPADLIGTQVFNPKEAVFTAEKGPLFSHLILADEINRAPAKVQSALLEVMQEKQITLAKTTYKLEEPFLVLATQNPIEQEGTYPLPEAQVDRFMLKVLIDYPNKEEEIKIMKRITQNDQFDILQVITPEKILELRKLISSIFLDEKLYDYIANIVFATRNPELFGLEKLKSLIEFGASPRASINLVKASKAHAFLQGRGYVTPQDIKTIGADVLRHRVMVSYEAEAQNITSDDILLTIFDKIDVP